MTMTNRELSSVNTAAKRLNGLDILKAICAFLVVCIHAPFPGEFGQYVIAAARIAVPIFIMITGYFYTPESAPRRIKKLLILLLTSSGIYLIWHSLIAAVKGELLAYLSETFTLKNILRFLLLNENHIQSHLWYLGAVLYVLIIVTLLLKISPKYAKKILFIITPILLICDLVFGKYSLLLLHREFSYVLLRNWLFVGLPFFCIGMWIKDHDIKLQKVIGSKALLIFMALFTLTSFAERFFLVSMDMNAKRDQYISTTLLAVTCFLFFLGYSSEKGNRLAKLGREASTWIYILHPMVIYVLDSAVRRLGITNIYGYVAPIAVFIITAIITMIINAIKKKLITKRN